MPFTNINFIFTAAQIAAIQAALNVLKSPVNMPVQFNLTKEERTSVPNISNDRYPYVQRTIKNHAPNNPVLTAGAVGLGAGTLAEADNDLTFYDQMEPFILQIMQILEIYRDTQQVGGGEAYKWMRIFYKYSQQAAANNVPGSDAVVDDLKTLFDKEDAPTPP